MASNFDRFKADIQRLTKQGRALTLSLQHAHNPQASKTAGLSAEEIKKLPDVRYSYEQWYSEGVAVIRQLMPDRLDDFTAWYKPKGTRKDILHSNYTMSDYLRGTTVMSYGKEVVGPSAGLTPLFQQSNILQTLERSFDSTLFDIRTLVQADLLDDELEAAAELNKNGFMRGAGAMCGVVLEAHLQAVAERHKIKVKKDPCLSDLNDALKTAATIDTATWRFMQHLSDLRNKCDHKKSDEPTKVEVTELIDGVKKITKTVF